MDEEKKKTYIGVKKVEASPENRDGKPGYYVTTCPEGYKGWIPKEVFEAAYLPVEIPNELTTIDIVRMIEASEIDVSTVGKKTTVVRVTLPTGFELVETFSCIDPANYSEEMGADICLDKIKSRLWELIGFALQWAHHGLKK